MHVCDYTTTWISSKYVHEQHTDHSEKDIEFNPFENRDIPCGRTHAQSTGGSIPTHGKLEVHGLQLVQKDVRSAISRTPTGK